MYVAIDEANLDREDHPPLKKSPETPIYGAGSGLDSLGLINLLAAVEEEVEREAGVLVPLANERALSREPSPFRSVRALVEYVEELLREKRGR